MFLFQWQPNHPCQFTRKYGWHFEVDFPFDNALQDQGSIANKAAAAAQMLDRYVGSAHRKNPIICLSVNLLFFMPVIFYGDGLHKL